MVGGHEADTLQSFRGRKVSSFLSSSLLLLLLSKVMCLVSCDFKSMCSRSQNISQNFYYNSGFTEQALSTESQNNLSNQGKEESVRTLALMCGLFPCQGLHSSVMLTNESSPLCFQLSKADLLVGPPNPGSERPLGLVTRASYLEHCRGEENLMGKGKQDACLLGPRSLLRFQMALTWSLWGL